MASYVRARPSLDDDPICTTRDASHILGVSVITAQTWMERGELSSWKTPGGHRRCRLSSITRLQNIVESSKDGAHSQQATELAGEFRVAINRDYPLPVNEEKRLLALAGSRLMDSAHEHAYDRITWLATQLTNCPMALVSLLSSERQWFKSRVGVNAVETPRAHAFCNYAILSDEGLLVEDARADQRFSNNPLVLGEPNIRFYAGVPVTNADGSRLGTLCVLDSHPRILSVEQLRGLRELADIVSGEIGRIHTIA